MAACCRRPYHWQDLTLSTSLLGNGSTAGDSTRAVDVAWPPAGVSGLVASVIWSSSEEKVQ